MDAVTSGRTLPQGSGRASAPSPSWAAAGVVLLLLALAGRVLTYPLQHDEQFYLPPGLLLNQFHLYRDIGFTHLPNLPLLLSALNELAGPSSALLTGRLMIVVAWLSLLLVIGCAGRLFEAGPLATATAAALLVFNTNLLGEAGMAATNNFVAFPFACAGVLLFIMATRHPERARLLAFASGLFLAAGAGFKANIAPLLLPIGIAALLVPPAWTWRSRLLNVATPLFVGGLVGALPTLLYFFEDATGFLVHVVEAHRGPQIAYWLSNPDPVDPKIMGWSGKLIFARDLWLGGTALLMVFVSAVLLMFGREQVGSVRSAAKQFGWETWLLTTIIAFAVALSFVPTPSFPQYFTIPLPFGAMLLLVLHGRLDLDQQGRAKPVLMAAAGIAVIGGAPSLLTAPAGLVQHDAWASTKLSEDSATVERLMREHSLSGPLATLEPLVPLVSSRTIVPELALGPFQYRAASYMTPEQRMHYRFLASPETIGAALDRDPPSAILVGQSSRLDAPLADFARRHGYQAVELPWLSGGGPRSRTLFLAPAAPSAP